jgi:hypothetical protein
VTRTLSSLTEALEWLEQHWDQRTIPSRLHTRDPEATGLTHDKKGCECLSCTDGPTTRALGSNAFAPSFGSYLDATPSQVIEEERTVSCYHPTLRGQDPRDCRECIGTGVKQQRVTRYRYPMWRAMTKLQNSLAPRRQPHPYGLVVVVAARGFQAPVAAQTLRLPWDFAEAAFLRAIRQLHSRYEESPLDTRRSVSYATGMGWLTMSEAQQNAVIAGEAA